MTRGTAMATITRPARGWHTVDSGVQGLPKECKQTMMSLTGAIL